SLGTERARARVRARVNALSPPMVTAAVGSAPRGSDIVSDEQVAEALDCLAAADRRAFQARVRPKRVRVQSPAPRVRADGATGAGQSRPEGERGRRGDEPLEEQAPVSERARLEKRSPL